MEQLTCHDPLVSVVMQPRAEQLPSALFDAFHLLPLMLGHEWQHIYTSALFLLYFTKMK
jgi:hypothetical protein